MKKDGMKKDGVIRSRRKFIKKLGGAALGAAAVSSAPMIGCSNRASATEWASTYDWICVGSGIEGSMQAAIYGHDLGLKTLLIEETALLGREAIHGLFYVPMNHLMKEAGIADSRDEALSWFRYIGGGYNSSEFIEAFVDNAPRAVEYLHKKADVKFRICPAPDFWTPLSEGGFRYREDISVGYKKLGRSLTVEPFPAETLGNWRNKIRLPETYDHIGEVLEGQEHNPSLGLVSKGALLGPHVGHWGPLRGVDSTALRLWRKRLGSAKLDALLKKDEEEFVAGAAEAAYMLRAMIQRGIEVRTETSAERLLVENGRVVGMVVNHGGKEESIKANRGILMGTGAGGGVEGWRLVACVGGEVVSEVGVPGGLTSFQVVEAPGITGSRGSNYEQRMRHSMLVNRFGERFANEEAYQGTERLLYFDALGEHRFRNIPSYFIFDQNLIEKYSFAGRPPGETEGLEWLAQGRTIVELAQKLNLPAAKLEATVARFNENARSGRGDSDFHRSAHTMRPLEKPPFYGVQAHKPDTNPLRGSISVITDTQGQVIHHRTKKPIPGLYAYTPLTNDQGRLSGMGYNAGLHTMEGITFALLSAEHAASKRLTV